jgi:polyisoprenoid-binding protein YceI
MTVTVDLAAETIHGSWQLDPARSSVGFRTRHLWGLATVEGHFDDFRGRFDLDADPAVDLTVDAASVQTGNGKRDQHLRSGDFFDADHHPTLRFRSEEVVVRADTIKLHGRLSARDRSIPLVLDMLVVHVDGELAVEATTTAPHRELGMTWGPLRMIPPRSELLVRGYLIPARSAVA